MGRTLAQSPRATASDTAGRSRRDRLPRRPRGAGGDRLRARRLDAQGRPLAIVHRDVSPTNIMVSFEGEVKLLDFGIVKAAERVTKTQDGVVKGNVSYMSPSRRAARTSRAGGPLLAGPGDVRLLSGEPFYQGQARAKSSTRRRPARRSTTSARIAKLPPPAPDFLRRVLALDSGRSLPERARVRPGPHAVRDDGEGPARRDDARAVRRHLTGPRRIGQSVGSIEQVVRFVGLRHFSIDAK